jgi:hypothetical protein
MNKQLSGKELDELLETTKPFEPVKQPEPMSRKEKLEHWATLVNSYKSRIQMLHEVEYHPLWALREMKAPRASIYDIAVNDPKLQAAGLTNPTIGGAIDFFELTQNEVHYLSCDCHGELSKDQMARRISNLNSVVVETLDRGTVTMVMVEDRAGLVERFSQMLRIT